MLAAIVASCLLATSLSGAAAQSLDPELLQQLQRRAGGTDGRPLNQPSLVDESREDREGDGERAFDEDRLNRLARQRDEPSRIERAFAERYSEAELEQFGYQAFAHLDPRAAPVTGRVSDDYVLGTGDELAIIFQGSEQANLLVKVDREGRIVAGKLPPVQAAGRSLGEVRRELESRTRETLLGTEIYVSMGAVKAVSVFVLGEVEQPGVYQLTSLSDVLSALAQAGGVKKSGSLRNIGLRRGDELLSIDLYDLFLDGAGKEWLLQDGDRIVVPVVGPVIGIAGDVRRPAIYELAPDQRKITASDALAMAGGTMFQAGHAYVRGSFAADGSESFTALSQVERDQLTGSDLLIVRRVARRPQGRAFLAGAVNAPGPRAIAATPSLATLVDGLGALSGDAYLPFAILETKDTVSHANQLLAVNLSSVLAGAFDRPLRAEDRLTVLGEDEIAFLSSDAVRQVVLGEANPLPQCTALDALSAVVRNTQSQRYAAVLRGVLVAGAEKKADQRQQELTQAAGAEIRAQAARNGQGTGNGVAGQRSDAGAAALNGDPQMPPPTMEERQQAKEAAEKQWQRQCPGLFQDYPLLLQFTLEHVVSITGAIRQPAVLPVAGHIDLNELVKLAGGLSRDADPSQIEVLDFTRRGDGQAQEFTRDVFDIADAETVNVMIKPGSGVQVRSQLEKQEIGGILLSGEFAHPGVYIIERGEKLSQVIARAGGITDQAYPYGAVFTRRSVKEAQQEGFRRTARELNAALVSAALKNNADGEAIEAVRQLAQTAETIEAPGRVVIEADPRVLALRPDLDPVVEPGDTLFMPKRPSHVLALGDVLNPGALQFVRGKAVNAYVKEAGGIQASADKGRMFLVYPNGVAQPVEMSAWTRQHYMVPPGSTIIVPKDTEPLAGLQLTREIVTILSQLTLSAASVAVISR
ncbi:MAG: hypothetical protein Tsb0016_22640 [Sphingomonadales bacterium]